MPSSYHKLIFRLEAGDLADYSALEDIFEENKEFSATALNRREHDSMPIPVAATVTLAIGAETVVGMYIKCTHTVNGVVVKWTQNGNANEQKLGEATPGANNGEWMFVPKVDSSTNVTLDGSAAAVSSARVLIVHD